MRWLHSVLFWSFFVASSAVLFCVALVLFLVTWPFDRKGLVLHLFSCGWAQLYFWVNPGWRLRIQGRERLPWHGPAVLVSNHQSLGDILVLFGLYRPFKWVSKASNFRLPFLGWNMYLNRYVSLVRGDKESIAKMMAQSERWLERGVPVLLFPEGTRSPDNTMRPFKDGAFRLAHAKGCPLIPMVLTGTGDTLPKHGLIIRFRANCEVSVLEPVDPRAFPDPASLRDHVYGLMEREKARLESGAAAP
ncbi:1-acyl-sn-glycerol-3-phosphate acyltransferase [Archangium gephyra]|uniref:1-acyl-sn-glycerol-3-phosphate acyltransferase n=1 Tax=Archangium gephyra TaxID=48 RepID=A0AAC8Q5B9_9BACT|nr:lysophospholipid acyltransferase family protein [Archangium gephyra]AKJ01353.1 1-acyl-sn-glycerol-3-phosphate acyltransferase [Archangium gephyra]REG34172.1 1-acyl-sn-glycerol-3-phosphate acyltransferase [Archangium gephyra]